MTKRWKKCYHYKCGGFVSTDNKTSSKEYYRSHPKGLYCETCRMLIRNARDEEFWYDND